MRRATRMAVVVAIFFIHLSLASIYLDSISEFWGVLFTNARKSKGYQKYVVPEWMNGTDKAIVMAKVEAEDTTWVTKYLPDWHPYIYTVNNPLADLTTPMNKGHEAMAYLTYIIDNYSHLPSTIAFVHAHQEGWWTAWHTDAPSHSNVISLSSLNLAFVQEAGYVNLRCDWKPGCLTSHRKNAHITEEIWQYMFGNEDAVGEDGNSTQAEPFPDLIGAPCCAQFAVSRTQVLRREKSEYERYRQWVIDTELSDAKSGRTMEFLWHVIFGKEAVFCPDQEMDIHKQMSAHKE